MDIKSLIRNGSNIFDLPLKVVYYARVSTEYNEQITSIINQVDFFIKYISGINNWHFVKGYVDEGISGKDVRHRENFLKMINDANDKKFDLILTKSVSRFARNTIDSIFYTNMLLDVGVGVFFINDNINTFYSDSEFRLTLMASIAQDEIRKLSESVKFGLRQSINRGVVLGSSNILGYYKDNGKLVIDDREALIVKDIYNLFLDFGYSYSVIAGLINERYNRKFNSSSIKRILTNYKYKGYYCGKKSEIVNYKSNKRKVYNENEWVIYRDIENVPPIIDESVWNRVNDIISMKKNTYVDIYKNKVFCINHGLVFTKYKRYKDKFYCYYFCKCCFRLSNKVLDRIINNRLFNKIIIYNRDDDIRVDIYVKK